VQNKKIRLLKLVTTSFYYSFSFFKSVLFDKVTPTLVSV